MHSEEDRAKEEENAKLWVEFAQGAASDGVSAKRAAQVADDLVNEYRERYPFKPTAGHSPKGPAPTGPKPTPAAKPSAIRPATTPPPPPAPPDRL